LFLAAEAGRVDNVVLLVESGAHLHADEKGIAVHLKQRAEQVGELGKSEAWRIAGA
jgi:lysophospholipase